MKPCFRKFFPICILPIFIFLPFTSFSQFLVGVKGGVNYANVHISTFTDMNNAYSYRPGYHFGLTFNYTVKKKIQFNPEVLLSAKGYKIDFPDGTDSRVRLNYISIPLVLSYAPLESVNILLGPEMGYLVGAKSKTSGVTTDIRNLWNQKIDIGVALGIRFNLSPYTFIEGRFTQGLSSIQDVNFADLNGNNIGTGQTRNRCIQLSIAFTRPFEW